jgi:hypothetical protein
MPLLQAMSNVGTDAQVAFHSDLGLQYASETFSNFSRVHGTYPDWYDLVSVALAIAVKLGKMSLHPTMGSSICTADGCVPQ